MRSSRGTWIPVVVLVGCYQPAAVTPCAFTCADATDCPDRTTMECNPTTQRCQLMGGSCGVGAAPDVTSNTCVQTTWFGQFCAEGGTPTMLEFVGAGTEIDTDTDQSCSVIIQLNGPDVCVIAAGRIKLDAKLRATGARALALVATTGNIELAANGSIDVSSRGSAVGAASGGTHCDSSGMNGGVGPDGHGGGAGGSYQGVGGNGGYGATLSSSPFAVGGVAQTLVAHRSTLAGGCAGGRGGSLVTSSEASAPGGGAVALIAAGDLVLEGYINASGSGGAGCPQTGSPTGAGGGGGAGAGGMIVLEGQHLRGGGRLVANGGGGGGGCSMEAGMSGGIASAEAPTIAAVPGAGGVKGGGSGGAGSANTDLVGGLGMNGDGAPGGGGGGGGGGAGHVLVNVTTNSLFGVSSPPPVQL